MAVPAVSAEYPECWVEVPYAQEPKQQAQAPTIAHGARGAREGARRAQSVTALAEELAVVDIEDVLKPDVFTIDDTGSSAWLDGSPGSHRTLKLNMYARRRIQKRTLPTLSAYQREVAIAVPVASP